MGMFDGKAGLVTGGASGMGASAALAFAREGGAVLVADIEAMRGQAEKVVADIVAAGGRAQFTAIDVSKEADVIRMVDETVAAFSSLDFAFNNAGILAVAQGAPAIPVIATGCLVRRQLL